MKAIRLPHGEWSYDPSQPLGPEGGFGAVYAGEGKETGPVAVKRLKLSAQDAAHREMRIGAELAGHQRGKCEQTHAQQWASRKPITDTDRDRLETLIRTYQRAIMAELTEFNPRNKNHVNKLLRQAIRRALLDDGLLTITRRSITPPLKPQKLAKIS